MAHVGLSIEQVRSLLELSNSLSRAPAALASQLQHLTRDLCILASASGCCAWVTASGARSPHCVSQHGAIRLQEELFSSATALPTASQIGTKTLWAHQVEGVMQLSHVPGRSMISVRSEPECIIYVVVARTESCKPFSASELTAVDLMVGSGWSPAADRQCGNKSSRQSQLLTLLKSGQSEKEIASAIGLSVNTVHHYVKQIYRRFGVRSRAELMSQWVF